MVALDNKNYTYPERMNYYYDENLKKHIRFKQTWNLSKGTYEPLYPEYEINKKTKDLENKSNYSKYIKTIRDFCDKFNLCIFDNYDTIKQQYSISIPYTKYGFAIGVNSDNNSIIDNIHIYSYSSWEECYYNTYVFLNAKKIYVIKKPSEYNYLLLSKYKFLCEPSKEF